MNYVFQFLSVVTFVTLADVCYVYYFIAVAAQKPLASGFWSVAVSALYALTAIGYIKDNTLLVAALLGHFIGTAASVQFNKMKSKSR